MIYIALLRAVNLGGHNTVRMSALREVFVSLGFDDVRTLLQSGNVVCRGSRRSLAAMERALQEATTERLGVTTEYIVRTGPEWQALIAANPFPAEAARQPNHLLLLALRDRPTAAAVDALQAAVRGSEIVRVLGRHAYIVYAEGIGRSRLTIGVIEKKLVTKATGRNWNTVLKLAALAGE